MSAKKAILYPDVFIDLQPATEMGPARPGPALRLVFDERDPTLGAILRHNDAQGFVVRWSDVDQVDYFRFEGVVARRAFFRRIAVDPEDSSFLARQPEGQICSGRWPTEPPDESRGPREQFVWWPKSS